MKLIQQPDTIGGDANSVLFWEFATSPSQLANGFVIIECAELRAKFVGQIVAPQLNLNRDALAPGDPTSMNQLEALHTGRFHREVAVKEAFLYKVQLIREITADGRVQSIRRRPQTGATCRAATAEELLLYLSLPDADDQDRVLGHLSDTTIPLALNRRAFMHHLLVSGTTGSGKSNVIGNIISAALASGATVIVFDMKPDFQNVHEANDEDGDPRFRGFSEVRYWRIGNSELGRDDRTGRYAEHPIHVPASELDGSLLARSIFFLRGEEQQADTFELLWDIYGEENSGSQYSLNSFLGWLTADTAAIKKKYELNSQNFGSVLSKLKKKSRRLSWIDGGFGDIASALSDKPSFDLASLVKSGTVNVIRISSDAGDGRGYALFLNYTLRYVYQLKEKNKITCPVEFIVDEAQEIFDRSDSAFQRTAGTVIGANVRKGRSVGIGFVFAAQSADRIPAEIMDNLNSRIVMRHKQMEAVKMALPGATPEQAAMTLTFGAGEALVDLFGAQATVHCRMRRSPFKLTKLGEAG